jgi:hypothetical protein
MPSEPKYATKKKKKILRAMSTSPGGEQAIVKILKKLLETSF